MSVVYRRGQTSRRLPRSEDGNPAAFVTQSSKSYYKARGDSNPRPLPCQSSRVRFYNNSEDRGDCQSTRKSYKTSHSVGWSVGWKKASMLLLSGQRLLASAGTEATSKFLF
jgi:hypothetical protein